MNWWPLTYTITVNLLYIELRTIYPISQNWITLNMRFTYTLYFLKFFCLNYFSSICLPKFRKKKKKKIAEFLASCPLKVVGPPNIVLGTMMLKCEPSPFTHQNSKGYSFQLLNWKLLRKEREADIASSGITYHLKSQPR